MGKRVNIKRIVEKMTIEEKLGQLTQLSSMFFGVAEKQRFLAFG